jgi:NAD(P)-dependent dehydrogenase (short-subunit alcohol dehydrogenase family)
MTPRATRQVKELAGKVALVTGGAVRVGRVIALTLARAAAHATVADLRGLGVRAVALRADIGRPAAARALVEHAARRLGRLDILVNNAAVFLRTPLAETTTAQWDRILGVNLRGAFFCAQAAARLLPRGGRIVNIADVGGVRAWPGYIPYGVSKAGLIMLTRGLAAALAPRISVNAVGPGVVLLPVGFPRAAAHRLRARIPMGREGRPEDVAATVRFFATCPTYITGQILFVDGGATTI